MRLNSFFINLLLLLLILFEEDIKAQDLPLTFKSYSSKDGLSSSTIYDICKDSYGFLWLATEDGLNRFDGTGFKVFRHNPQQASSLRVNHITALYEGENGFIWVGTNGGGLSYYDQEKDSIINYGGNQKINSAITSIFGDRDGKIWVGSYGGLYIVDSRDKKLVEKGKYGQIIRKFSGKIVFRVFQDSQQNMWIGTDAGLYLIKKGLDQIKLFTHVEKDLNSLASNSITTITEDQRGAIWVGTLGGLSMFLPGSYSFRNFRHTGDNPNSIRNNTIYAVATDGTDRLWIGTNGGLDVMNLNDYSITSYTPDRRNLFSLSSRSIRSIFIDKEGIYWVGTFQGGLNKYDKNQNNFNLKECNTFDPYGLRSPLVTYFAEYDKGVFVGTDGGGLHFFSLASGLLDHIKLLPSDKDKSYNISILTMEMGKNNRLYIGTFQDGLFLYNPLTGNYKHFFKGTTRFDLNQDVVFCLKEDHLGNLWIGTNGGGVNVLRADGDTIDKFTHQTNGSGDSNQISSNYVRAITEDHLGRIWIGTFGSGISVYDPIRKKFSVYNRGNSGLPSDYILSITEDHLGNIWVGTNGNGIVMMEKGEDHFITFAENNGLANATVLKIIEDTSGKIWLSTNAGLSCFDKATSTFKNYSESSGLQSGAFILGAGLRLSNGELFFGGQNGFNHFNPTSLRINKNIPKVVLTGLKIDNQSVSPRENGSIRKSILSADNIRLKYKQNFSISFEGLNYTVPEQNQYEYRLEGVDKGWIRAGKDHSAYYTNLDPGEYIFRVRASNNDEVWNLKGKTIKIFVAPPFWRTTLAYIAYVLLFFGVLFLIRRRGIMKLEMKFAIEQERIQAKQLVEQERKEAEHLRELDKMKLRFLTNLSHEFRTPISLIMGPVDSLIGQINETKYSNQLSLIKRNARRLLNLVNQLLDFRKMEVQELKLHCNKGDLVSFMQEVCDSFNDIALRKKMDYAFFTELRSAKVLFDSDKIERILFNLLSNAFKFTPEKGTISVTLTEQEENSDDYNRSFTIFVKDSGIGIPRDVKDQVFENFFQHDSGTTVLNQGTGIGLSISREFVKMHGGTIWVESEQNKGSQFVFKLLLKRTDHTESTDIDLSVQDPLLYSGVTIGDSEEKTIKEQVLVLIVEDDDDFRFYMKDNLKSSYRLLEARDGKEGWQRALFHHPDIIVCDVNMPQMNGLELVKKLKSDKRTHHIPVILLTAAHEASGQLSGLESGATDYMTKPFDFPILKAKIESLLLLNRAFKDTYTKQVKIGVSDAEMELVSEKDKFLKKLISYVDENISSPKLSVELLSSHMLISRASLYNRILEFTGMTPVELIRSVKLDRAIVLLEKSDLPVAEIAYELGFAHPNYFTKVFKAKYNMTPSEYIQKERKINGSQHEKGLTMI